MERRDWAGAAAAAGDDPTVPTCEARCDLGLLAERRGEAAAARAHDAAALAAEAGIVEHVIARERLAALAGE